MCLRKAAANIERWNRAIGGERTVAQIIESTGTTNDTNTYRHWAGAVSRYSSRTLEQ